MDADITLSDLEDGGTPWDKFAWGIWVGMVRNQREYGAKWGGSKRGGGGQGASSQGGGEGGGGVAAITQPGFYRGVEAALHQGEPCFKTLGSNPKWVPLSGKPSQPCQRCIQRGVSREQALHWMV